jgi:hypothetical protein
MGSSTGPGVRTVVAIGRAVAPQAPAVGLADGLVSAAGLAGGPGSEEELAGGPGSGEELAAGRVLAAELADGPGSEAARTDRSAVQDQQRDPLQGLQRDPQQDRDLQHGLRGCTGQPGEDSGAGALGLVTAASTAGAAVSTAGEVVFTVAAEAGFVGAFTAAGEAAFAVVAVAADDGRILG